MARLEFKGNQMQLTGTFNANQFEPNQGGQAHPVGLKFPFQITNTEIKENSSKTGGYFQVELTSLVGSIKKAYNIWYKGENEAKTVEIAHGQLSALCRAVNIYQIDWGNEGAALRGGRGMMDIGYQKGEEPTEAKPGGGYVEVKRIYDAAGNEPGKVATASGLQGQPMTQQPGGGWGNQAPNPNPSQQPAQGWQQPVQNAAVQQNQAGQAWQPGGNAPNQDPPWGKR